MKKYLVFLAVLIISMAIVVPAFAYWDMYVAGFGAQKVFRYDGLTGADKPGEFSEGVSKPGAQFAEADLSRPTHAVVGNNGVYVTDYYGPGRFYDTHGRGGDIFFAEPDGATTLIFRDSYAYIACRNMPDGSEPGTIMQYTATGTLVKADYARIPSNVSGYWGMCFLPNGTILAVDAAGQFVQFLNDGTPMERWNTPSPVNTPVDVMYYESHIYVVGGNSGVHRFTFDPLTYGSASIVLESTWNLNGMGSSGSMPWGIASGPDGNLYVSYRGDSNVKRYNTADGAYIDTFVTSGQGGLDGPMKISFNEVAPPAASLTGTVFFLDFYGDKTTIPVTVELGNGIDPITLNLDADGNFTILNVPAGTYDVRIKASHWLARMTPGVVVAGVTVMDPVNLINGDVVDNNEVDFTDINATRAAYGSFPGDETWNELADVDGSGEVDFTDINIVRGNYGEIGD